MNEWNIQSRSHACTACERPFADREMYHTLLFEEKAEFRRSDVCDTCWQQQFSQGGKERKGFVSYWHGVYEAPPAHAVDPIQKETAEGLLRKLIERDDPAFIPAAFILAVMLERKRVFKVKEQFLRDAKRYFVYELPRTGEVFTILDPNLHLHQLEQVQHDVAHLLEHGLNPAPGADPAIATAQALPQAADPPADAAPDRAWQPAEAATPTE